MSNQDPATPSSPNMTTRIRAQAPPLNPGAFFVRWTVATCLAWLASLLMAVLPEGSRLQMGNLGTYDHQVVIASPPAAFIWIVVVSSIVGGAQWWAMRPYARRAALWMALSTLGGLMGALLSGLPLVWGARFHDYGWMQYPIDTAVPLAITQTIALLLLSERKWRAASWLLARLVTVTFVSLVGGALVYLSASSEHWVLWSLAVAYTLLAGLPSAVASGLYVAWVLQPRVSPAGEAGTKMSEPGQ
jgi:hypothetical protein